MRQVSIKGETPRLKLESSDTFLAIKRCQQTKFGKVINSLTAIDGHDYQYFNKLRARMVSPRVFVHCQRLMARKIAELFGLNRGIRPFTQLVALMS